MSETLKAALTPSLEDYLETIYELVRDRKVARVKDIARARKVKAGSVSPAMRRLADLGMIRYFQREYIDLTSQGEEEARRVTARHRLLTMFFEDVLQMGHGAADREACALEHSLSNEGMERLTRLFEFMSACPEGREDFIERFRRCPQVNEGMPDCGHRCKLAGGSPARQGRMSSVFDLKPGQKARVARVEAAGSIRQRLLDMGLLPDVVVEFERTAPGGDPIWIKLLGGQLALRKKEAQAILVAVEAAPRGSKSGTKED